MIELLVGAVFSALVFLFYLVVCVLLPAAIGLLVASRLPLVGQRTDGWWLRLRRILQRRAKWTTFQRGLRRRTKRHASTARATDVES